VKKGKESVLDDLPMMTFDDDPQAKGWRSMYLGLFSPFQNKYTAFMKHAIEKAKEASPSKNNRDVIVLAQKQEDLNHQKGMKRGGF
jgi:hypothetical protein